MKNFNRGIVMVVALGMAALSFMSCSSNSTKLVSITVTPVDPVIASEIQFTATGTFSDGMVLNYTSAVIWSSSSPSVATVGTTVGTTGYVTVLSTGTTTITAREPYNNYTSSTLLTIVTPSAITITPENPVMVGGTSHQFVATALWSGGTASQSLMSSPTLTWTSDSSIATVSRGFVTTGVTTTITSVNITATDTFFTSPTNTIDISFTTAIKITPTVLTSITVTSQSPSMPVFSNQTFSAIGTFQDTQIDITPNVNWYSSPTGSVLVSKGSATAGGDVGPVYIIATDPITNVTGSAIVTVTSP